MNQIPTQSTHNLISQLHFARMIGMFQTPCDCSIPFPRYRPLINPFPVVEI